MLPLNTATKYKFKLTSNLRARVIYWASFLFTSKEYSTWKECMYFGWRLMYFEYIYLNRKEFLFEITFIRKMQNVSPTKPRLTKRLITSNTLPAEIIRNSVVYGKSDRVNLEVLNTWYFYPMEYTLKGEIADKVYICLRKDAVLKITGIYKVSEVVSKMSLEPSYV